MIDPVNPSVISHIQQMGYAVSQAPVPGGFVATAYKGEERYHVVAETQDLADAQLAVKLGLDLKA